MREDADTADLCLVLGTSLGGLNADQERLFFITDGSMDRTMMDLRWIGP